METISKNLKEQILELMIDMEIRDTQKIKDDLKLKNNLVYGKDYRESHFSSVLRSLTINGKLKKVKRGIYSINQLDYLEHIFHETIFELNKLYYNLEKDINIITASSSQSVLKNINQLLELKDDIREVLKNNPT